MLPELLKLGARRPRTALGILKLGAGALGPAAKALERLLDALEELVPDSERVTIPHASHLVHEDVVHEDNAARFNAAVTSFLSRRAPVD